ncbi:hypothetical protein CKAH01_12232 [Colletotrichum kahawae]|uniref:Uncharacterized protein n=1 Tax=Colletotrichum kahawae TaxID=34407 RepID=A0AAD9YU56_COLKA|nr:hypothetical protein CKAH01_12232 [Colletotrichum kahawae]
MAAPSSASQAVLTTHSSIDEVYQPRRVPPEIFLLILDELIAAFEGSMEGDLFVLTSQFPHFSDFGYEPSCMQLQRHRLACFTKIALISKDAHAHANRNFGRRFQVWTMHQKLRKMVSCPILTLPRIDKFSVDYDRFYYIDRGLPWTPSLQCRTSLMAHIETLGIKHISPPKRFTRILSDFPNVKLFLVRGECRERPNWMYDKKKLCSHGDLLAVNEKLLPILQEGSPSRKSIEKALDRGSRVILERYIGRNDVEVFSTQEGLRAKLSNNECACDAPRLDSLERWRYLLGPERCPPRG